MQHNSELGARTARYFPMRDTPSTKSFVIHGAFKVVGFVVVYIVLDETLVHRRQPITWAITIGFVTGMIDMAWLYRLAAWRRAVAPVHAFGSASVGLAIVVAANAGIAVDGKPDVGCRIAAGMLFLAAPLYIMVESARELWTRRSAAGPAPN